MKRQSADLLFVHGIGMWPKLFRPVQRLVCATTTDDQIWVRPGYSDATGPRTFGEQLDVLMAEIERRGPVIVVGVGEGATLALACATRRPDGLDGIVTHEPSIGPLEAELHQRMHGEAVELAATPSISAVDGFLTSLYAPSWATLPVAARRWAHERHRVVGQEAIEFASYTPSLEELTGINIPHLTTVGTDSGPERHRVADLLREHGATSQRINDCAHLVLRSQPRPFAAAITSWASLTPTQAASL